VGVIGLMKAIDHFDLSYDVCFSTYAVPLIIGEIKRYMRDNNSIKISRSIKETAYKIKQLQEKFLEECNRKPSLEELSNFLNLDREQIILAYGTIQDIISLDAPVYNEKGDASLVKDYIPQQDDNIDLVDRIHMNNILLILKEEERYVIENRFFMGKTQSEIAIDLGVSQAQVSRIEKRGLNHLREQWQRED